MLYCAYHGAGYHDYTFTEYPEIEAALLTKLDINGDGVYLLAQIGISAHFYQMLPYLITIIVLAFTSKSSRAPKAEGIPYDKGQR